jgi:hypothetical protein
VGPFSTLTIEHVMAQGDQSKQKQYLGDLLYHQIVNINIEHAGRITGMMLESLGMERCIHDMKNPADLQKTVNEALAMIKAASESK